MYFVDDRPFTEAARVRVAVWGYGNRAVASGLAAAFWLGYTKFAPQIVEVTVQRRGLHVTCEALTLVEAAVRRPGAASIVDSALQRDMSLRDLWAAHLRNKGRYGSPAARRLLQAASDGARSEAERLFLRLLRQAGITGWKTNYPVGGYKVDVGFPASKVAVEIDGFAFHSDAVDFQGDRERQNAITMLGWQVLRFTWLDLTEYPQRALAVLRKAISAR